MGILYLVSTPIGNREDITLRAIKTIFSVDYLLCEDTRKTGLLLQWLEEIIKLSPPKADQPLAENYQIYPEQRRRIANFKKPQLLSYYEQNEPQRIPQIINYLNHNLNIALVSNAGTPTLADPGYKLVRECLANQIKVMAIPGASALLTGLVSSGAPTDKFIYLGFLPKKSSHRVKLFQNLIKISDSLSVTVVFYETPQRILKALEDLNLIFGDINLVICRELTKLYEEIISSKISVLKNKFTQSTPKGEMTVIFSLKNVS